MLSSHFAFRRVAVWSLVPLLFTAGCGRLAPHPPPEYVYVWVKGASLRDRVAVVSNLVAEVNNGERLLVIEHGRRFLKVKTAHGDIGWIEDHGVIDQKVYDQFQQLAKDHEHSPVVSTGVLLDDYWLRDAPGRTSDRFYLLPENDKLQMLERASVPKSKSNQPVPVPLEKPAERAKNEEPPPPELEDYWLVRDSAGQVGWVRSRVLDEDVPDAIAGLGEGQKIVGAYVLRTVTDTDANVPGNQVPEYVTVLAPWKDGLPYDFDQVRVFTWNVKKHRYETAYRERNIAGYLPVTVSQQQFGNQQEPVFSYRVASGEAVAVDPETGSVRPANTVTESFHMEGVIVRRIGEEPRVRTASSGAAPQGREKGRRRGHG